MKKILECLLAGMMVLSLAGCGKSYASLYEKALKSINAGNYEEAVTYLKEAIEIDPKQAEAYLTLADAYTDQGSTDDAIIVLTSLSEAVPENTSGLYKLSHIYADTDDYENAVQTMEKLIELIEEQTDNNTTDAAETADADADSKETADAAEKADGEKDSKDLKDLIDELLEWLRKHHDELDPDGKKELEYDKKRFDLDPDDEDATLDSVKEFEQRDEDDNAQELIQYAHDKKPDSEKYEEKEKEYEAPELVGMVFRIKGTVKDFTEVMVSYNTSCTWDSVIDGSKDGMEGCGVQAGNTSVGYEYSYVSMAEENYARLSHLSQDTDPDTGWPLRDLVEQTKIGDKSSTVILDDPINETRLGVREIFNSPDDAYLIMAMHKDTGLFIHLNAEYEVVSVKVQEVDSSNNWVDAADQSPKRIQQTYQIVAPLVGELVDQLATFNDGLGVNTNDFIDTTELKKMFMLQ
ncbi:tetratricopeptide repeat protein [Anaerolactibacter massiliensis]|uniref:tetratricopeptide repeat protein n=1 Tax=Anaerolactibacter massiliensis TaxID=2044573 RepID=UPI000CF9F3C5|nr:tetratricopeptide repeat protein [Anaerolactibacter massiliensis]